VHSRLGSAHAEVVGVASRPSPTQRSTGSGVGAITYVGVPDGTVSVTPVHNPTVGPVVVTASSTRLTQLSVDGCRGTRSRRVTSMPKGIWPIGLGRAGRVSAGAGTGGVIVGGLSRADFATEGLANR
jgi:hypothetical protein